MSVSHSLCVRIMWKCLWGPSIMTSAARAAALSALQMRNRPMFMARNLSTTHPGVLTRLVLLCLSALPLTDGRTHRRREEYFARLAARFNNPKKATEDCDRSNRFCEAKRPTSVIAGAPAYRSVASVEGTEPPPNRTGFCCSNDGRGER